MALGYLRALVLMLPAAHVIKSEDSLMPTSYFACVGHHVSDMIYSSKCVSKH